MKRTITNPTGLIILSAVALSLIMSGCTSNQQTASQTKPAKALVTSLPPKIKGVELVDNTVRVKPGYQWVKQPNGTVTVARMGGSGGGGRGVGGTWECYCTLGPYKGCEAEIDESSLRCAASGGDCLSCKLKTTTGTVKTDIIMY